MLKSQYFLLLTICLMFTACGKKVSSTGQSNASAQPSPLSDAITDCEMSKRLAEMELAGIKAQAQDSFDRGSLLIKSYYAALEAVDHGKNDRRRNLVACYGDDLNEGKFNYDHRDVKAELERNKNDYLELHFKNVSDAAAPAFANAHGVSNSSFKYQNATSNEINLNPGSMDARTDLALEGKFVAPGASEAQDQSLAAFNVKYLALESVSREPAVRANYLEIVKLTLAQAGTTTYSFEISLASEALVLSQSSKSGEKHGLLTVTKEIPTTVQIMLKNSTTGENDFRFGYEDDAAESARYIAMMVPQNCQAVSQVAKPNWR